MVRLLPFKLSFSYKRILILALSMVIVTGSLAFVFIQKGQNYVYFKQILFVLIAICIAHYVLFVTLLVYLYSKTNNLLFQSKSIALNKILSPLIFLATFAIFPLIFLANEIFVLFHSVFKKSLDKRFVARKFLLILLGIGIILPVWILQITASVGTTGEVFGWNEDRILLSGTGSMYPTFPKGTGQTIEEQSKEVVAQPLMLPYPNGIPLGKKRLFSYSLKHGDIVSFENDITRKVTQAMHGTPVGLVKRVIGLPGDTIEIRDGLVFLNNQFLPEPYIARARSTFGGEALPDCKILTIPQNKVVVMGDNRKASGDSRQDIGLVSFEDIDHVLPLNKQIGVYDANWRDTSNDQQEDAKIKLDTKEFLGAINKERQAQNLKPLTYQPKLESSARLRAQIMLNFDDYSFEATRSGYTMEKAMAEVGYSNIVYGEVPIPGYYEADEFFEYLFEFPQTKEFFLGKDYEEIGIAQVEGEINNCPTQIIVGHIAGYIPPNYKQEDIEGWRESLAQLKDIEQGWKDLKNYPIFYGEHTKDLDRLIELIDIRIGNISGIVTKMQANQWLTKEQVDYTYRDEEFAKEQNDIADRLNNSF